MIITPLADGTPADRRRIALDEDELTEVQTGWASTMRHDTEDMAFVILREPCHTEGTPKGVPPPSKRRAHRPASEVPGRPRTPHRASIISACSGATAARSTSSPVPPDLALPP
ncbi:hypothetical protein ACFYW8_37730 [Streptomyces sp. NPDC002742]|uniref:hypothetical protein n=1 Tax=Streptomyces sp. NPDC002742 TaxID=3364663 RepID=UPI0036B48A8B